MLKRSIYPIALVVCVLGTTYSHNSGSSLTWNREISRVFYAKCAECHRKGGSAFSMMTYPEVQPHINEIQTAILNRRMPPWGAVKGFGDFRNDRGLSYEEIELISDWIDSGARKGNNANVLPPTPKFKKAAVFKTPKGFIASTGPVLLDRPFILDGLYLKKMPDTKSARVVAEFPDGHIEPLLWLYEFTQATEPFLFRNAIELPVGTRILGVPNDAEILLLPGKKGSTSTER